MILLTLLSLRERDERLFFPVSYVVFGIIMVYVFLSAIPHGLNNLRWAWYHEYKLWLQTEEGSIMKLHPDYFSILWEINIDDAQKWELYISYRNQLLRIIDSMPELWALRNIVTDTKDITTIQNVLAQLDQNNFWQISYDIADLSQDLHELVIYPPREYKSNKNIYRVGTFMKYFISDNNSRVWDDALLNKFDSYVYDEDTDITKERLEKLNISYLLFDLNAATIDNDERRALTTRFENMLRFTLNDGLELIETDSICLKLGRELYAKNNDIEEYMTIAGSNYDSLNSSRVEKRTKCAEEIIRIIQNETIDTENYSYLQIYLQVIAQSGINVSDINAVSEVVANRLPIWYKALFKIQ